MTFPVPLSVLDLAPVSAGATAADALRASLDLVREAERLGYRRHWVAEHHNMPGIASSAPAVLIAHLASVTERIRVGAGGVMLPNHAPLVVAEQFGMLEALHPGRIDLGIGRAPGTDPRTAAALRGSLGGLQEPDLPALLGELLGFFNGTFPPGHPYGPITAVPARGYQPALWLLGSSDYSARLAGALGLPFSFAHHFAPANTDAAVAIYRQAFRPSEVLDAPYVLLGAAALVAPTAEEAAHLGRPGDLAFLRLRSGRPGPFPTPEEAEAYHPTPHERELLRSRAASRVEGDPEQVLAGLDDLRTRTGADELMITTMVHRPADRLRSYGLLAEAAGLAAPADPAPAH